MSVSGTRAVEEINLEEFEKRLRAAGAQQDQREDPLSELRASSSPPTRGPDISEAPVSQAVGRPVEMETEDRNRSNLRR